MASKFILIPWARYQTLLALEDGTPFNRGERAPESCQAGEKSSSTELTHTSSESPHTVPEAGVRRRPSAVHPSVPQKLGSPPRPKTEGRQSQEGASVLQSGFGPETDEEATQT